MCTKIFTIWETAWTRENVEFEKKFFPFSTFWRVVRHMSNWKKKRNWSSIETSVNTLHFELHKGVFAIIWPASKISFWFVNQLCQKSCRTSGFWHFRHSRHHVKFVLQTHVEYFSSTYSTRCQIFFVDKIIRQSTRSLPLHSQSMI